ncbi:MAG: hypothetical protein VX310_02455 [Gemmatimonadota bacterium]|nr:hypothetical protein [Gemmatimonadota bacterium]
MSLHLPLAHDDSRGVGIVATLEGGYDPARTGFGAAAVLRALAGIDGLR